MSTGATAKIIHLPGPVKAVRARLITPIDGMDPYEEGFARGYSDGRKMAETECRKKFDDEYQKSRTRWDEAVKNLDVIPRELVEKLREQLVSLAFECVQKILAASPITREEVAAQVNQMLQEAEAGAEIRVQLHPEDLALLKDQDQAALTREDLPHVKWEANASLQRGDCLLRGDFGLIDGRRSTRLKKLEEKIYKTIPPKS
jgi:flagellar biosynthesis/type III secretory pathway protein FliH